jgi:4-methyl-5(b-hydroxyethyl)-thiazole monophosphate biosynthesis
VKGAHNIIVTADRLFEALSAEAHTTLILPGGPGTPRYKTHAAFLDLLRAHHERGGRIAAICAAPGVLGMLGFLAGKRACCYPGFEGKLTGASVSQDPVVTDGSIITGQSAGASLAFGLAVLAAVQGQEAADRVRQQLLLG